MRYVWVVAIRAYQWTVSPFLGPSCRYVPTCSDYAAEAVREHGVVRGAWLALARLARCHPLGGWGADPVPPVPLSPMPPAARGK